MSEDLEVALRETTGKLRNRRLRQSGELPAVLYGHGEETLTLAIATDQLEATLRHGAKVVQLQGAAAGQALLQEIQWDTFHQHVLHVDLLRVDASDRVTVEVPLMMHGIAPGESEGGVVEQVHHTLEIETSPAAIPERFEINVNDLHLHGMLTIADIESVPEEVKFTLDTETTIVQCVEPTVMPEEEEAAATGEEPEVIGRKEGDEQGEGDSGAAE